MDSANRTVIKINTYRAATLGELQKELKRIVRMTKAAGIKPEQVDIVHALTLTFNLEINSETGSKLYRLKPHGTTFEPTTGRN
jgi:hypothetical protein